MKLEIFEEALCCSTGVCGPSVDEDLLRITGVFETFKQTEMTAVRYNLSANPAEFAQNEQVLNVLKEQGNTCLPLTLVDDQIVKSGQYPSNQELEVLTGIQLATTPAKNSCCGGSSCC
ncbi:MAG: arsenite efflux transporter metallochaperone ArsD [Enterococcus sp.]